MPAVLESASVHSTRKRVSDGLRKDRSLKTVSDAGHVYEKAGKHTICVKVVDVFGCDTSIKLEVAIN